MVVAMVMARLAVVLVAKVVVVVVVVAKVAVAVVVVIVLSAAAPVRAGPVSSGVRRAPGPAPWMLARRCGSIACPEAPGRAWARQRSGRCCVCSAAMAVACHGARRKSSGALGPRRRMTTVRLLCSTPLAQRAAARSCVGGL